MIPVEPQPEYAAFDADTCATSAQLDEVTFRTLDTLTASNIGTTTARLTIATHTGQWWYKADVGPDNTCKGPVAANTATKDLTSLTAGTAYTYTAYDATGCAAADVLSTTASFTTNVTAGNLSETTAQTLFALGDKWGQQFTTGSASGGYTLLSVTVDFTAVTNPTGITVSLRAESSGSPGETDLATLTGTPADGQVTFTCSGSGCNLAASTSYYVIVGPAHLLGISPGNLRTTASDSETLQPSTNGWSIANTAIYEQGNWLNEPSSHAMKLSVEAAVR